MKKLIKLFAGVSLVSALGSCGTLNNDVFVYMGKPVQYPSYQLYFDKTKDLFVIVDKINGCLEKNNSGTCMAFDKEETESFRKNVLEKMIAVDKKLEKDSYGSASIPELEKAGITTVTKPIPTDNMYASPVKQIIVDRKKEYHLVRLKQKVGADMIATIVSNGDKKEIKVIYTVVFPDMIDPKKANIPLKPYVVDPEWLYYNMTPEAVKIAEQHQKSTLSNHKETKVKGSDYLDKIVDTDTTK